MVSLQMAQLNEEYCFHPPAGKEAWVRRCMHAETTRNTDFVLPVNPASGVLQRETKAKLQSFLGWQGDAEWKGDATFLSG